MNELTPNTFFMDFRIADRFGIAAIKDTYRRAFAAWKTDYKMLTALVAILNRLCWYHYDKKNETLAKLYSDLFYKARDYGYDTLKGEEFQYFYDMID